MPFRVTFILPDGRTAAAQTFHALPAVGELTRVEGQTYKVVASEIQPDSGYQMNVEYTPQQ